VQSAILPYRKLSVRPSVCLCVTLVICGLRPIGWVTSKIITPIISLSLCYSEPQQWLSSPRGTLPKFGWNRDRVAVFNKRLPYSETVTCNLHETKIERELAILWICDWKISQGYRKHKLHTCNSPLWAEIGSLDTWLVTRRSRGAFLVPGVLVLRSAVFVLVSVLVTFLFFFISAI